MIRYLHGRVAHKIRNQLVIDVGGVGYGVTVPPVALTAVNLGATIELFIAEAIREDGYDLYGFVTLAEWEIFELVRKVSGVGPKVALAIVSSYDAEKFFAVINQSDASQFRIVPGVGTKLASKIILELRGKLPSVTPDNGRDDTVSALESLGFRREEIAPFLAKIPPTISEPKDRVAWVLHHLHD